MKKILIVMLTLMLAFTLCSCKKDEGQSITIAYQYGIAYAPAVIVKEEKMIEKKYKEITGEDIEVEWVQVSSGSDINTGMMTGDIDVGFMGVAPAITGIAKGLDYKIFINLSGQEHGLMTNNVEINNLTDVVSSGVQIALVSLGSIQHIILAKALYDNGFDAHALDSSVVGMKHPDGMSSVESGNIPCHLTSSPYIYLEKNNSDLHEITEISNAWNSSKSFIVGITNEDVHEDKTVYNVVRQSLEDAIEMINNDVDAAASITCASDGNDLVDEKFYLTQGTYTSETSGLYELAQFMIDNQFCEGNIDSFEDMVFAEVKGN